MYTIRSEEPPDISFVRALHRKAFGRPAEGQLVDVVRAGAETTFCLVAVDDADPQAPRSGGGVVAHVLFCPVSIQSPKSCKLIGLGPMAVDPDHQRVGLGRRLIEEGLVRCRAAGYDGVVVLGHPAYYPKFGFVLAVTSGIHLEHEVPGDPFMVLELTPQALDGVTGVVRYLPEFLSL